VSRCRPDYWQPRIAGHLWRQVAPVGDVRLLPGMPPVLVVLNPTARTQRLRALDLRATFDRDEFFAFQHGDGRLKLIERLTAAYPRRSLPATCSISSNRSARRPREPRPEPPTGSVGVPEPSPNGPRTVRRSSDGQPRTKASRSEDLVRHAVPLPGRRRVLSPRYSSRTRAARLRFREQRTAPGRCAGSGTASVPCRL
jgi:hypothetical protein